MEPIFSPYSRGWSPVGGHQGTPAHDSPRIRGDGPPTVNLLGRLRRFSPYSRGWSVCSCLLHLWGGILPVFAGMVPSPANVRASTSHSPRIRGDGPVTVSLGDPRIRFSPYSRGWSPSSEAPGSCCTILPVFAGMVRFPRDYAAANCNSPRIRGDGPPGHKHSAGVVLFSPYSRGWSAPGFPKPSSNRILPVFAGMVRLGA